MSKTLVEAPLTTRNARSKLPAGIYFKAIDAEVHLGYRRGHRAGVWFVRWRHGQGYRQVSMGTADDHIAADNLDFGAALQKARATVEQARKEARAAAEGPVPTVRSAVREYIAKRDKRDSARKGRPVRSDAARLELYLLGRGANRQRKPVAAARLADVPLHGLVEADLLKWRHGLPEGFKASGRQRLINDLKAALNDAYAVSRHRLDPSFPAIVKYGLKAERRDDDEGIPIARDNQILGTPQVALLLRVAAEVDAEEEWGGDLYRIVVALAATGARFSQVARMRVGDVQRNNGRLLVPVSRKGKGAKTGTTPVPVGTDTLDALQPAVTGRPADAPLFERWRHVQKPGGIEWERGSRGPWQSPSELARPWQAMRDRSGMRDVIPYALRHSSIVRGIKANLPIRLVAAMHDTSVQMIERHYSKWIVDGLEELAARAVVSLVPSDSEKVVVIRGRS